MLHNENKKNKNQRCPSLLTGVLTYIRNFICATYFEGFGIKKVKIKNVAFEGLDRIPKLKKICQVN